MRRTARSLMVLLLLVPAVSFGSWVSVSSSQPQGGDVAVLEDAGSRTTLSLTFAGYEREEIDAGGTRCVRIATPGMAPTLVRGEPELPIWTESIIIPDRGVVSLRVVESQWDAVATLPVVPSKGSISRSIDPATVPYEFGALYGRDEWSPGPEVSLGEPFILRDYRGVTVQVYPVQYNGARGEIRVLRRLVVEVETVGSGGENELEGQREGTAREFERIYEGMFANLGSQRRTMEERAGRMLIIAADAYHDGMADLVSWKREKGIDTKLVRYSEIGGTGYTAVKNYIQSEYNAGGLVFVLLVGDLEHIPTQTFAGGEADPMYGLLAGGDVYPDAFVSRFSVQNASDLSTQVLRSVEYERSPTAASAWYHKATGIASNQGSPPDYQWMNGFRTKLLNYTYTEMDQIYDPSATAAMVTTALNAGRSLVLYMGHGSSTSWTTTGFSNTNVNALSNYWMLPVIHSVACDNGNFSTTTCFGEAWLRAQSGGQPRGALAAYMSSISQGWTPPQYGQQGFVDSLVSDRYNTVGGTLFIGGMAMLEHYNGGYDGTSHFNTWIIFGDCSVQMRTDSPAAMAATYPTAVLVGTSSIPVTVAGVEGALVGVSAEGEWLGSGYTDGAGTVNVTLNEPLNVPGTVKLTITGYNKEPIQADIEVIPPTGPYVIYQSNTVLGDGQADIGETVSLNIELKNVGIETAYGVVGTLSTTNGQIAVTAPSQGYGDMAPGATALPGEPYVFEVGSLADNTVVPFHLDIVSGLDSWEADFPLAVHAPDLAEAGWQIDDTEGNGNGRLDPGETVGLTVTVVNSGSGTALGTQLAISESDPYLTIIGPTTQALGDIPSGAQTISPAFTLTADGDCPIPYGAQLSLQISSNAGFHTVSGVVNLLVGQADLLVVDSDAEITETRIIDALLELGYAHTRWNTFEPGKAVVPLDTLLAHHTVIWTAGDQGSTSITPDNQANLIAYLNQEGSLLLSAENYAPNYPSAPLTTSYLRIASSQANISGSAVDGTTDDPVGDGISATLSYPTGLDVMPDAVTPGIGAVTVFRMQGGNSSVVIRYAGEGPASFKTMFFGVPLEAFPALAPNPDNIGTVIARSLSWLAGGDILAPTAPSNPMLANDGTLSWSPATDNVGVDYYSVYRSLSAFFSVQGMTPWATPAGTSVQITEGLGDVAVNYTYRVTATDAAGNESPASPPVGEFDFEIQE